jgi:lipid-A-disaccharide synthase
MLFRSLAQIDTVILVNLVLGEKIVPEYLQADCTPERIAAGLIPLLSDIPQRRRQVDAFARLDAIMGFGGPAPSARAAARVLDRVGLLSQTSSGLPSAARSC